MNSFSVAVSSSRELANIFGDSGSSPGRVNVTADILTVCFAEDSCPLKKQFPSAEHGDDLFVAFRGLAITTSGHTTRFQALDAQAAYGGRTFLRQQPKSTKLPDPDTNDVLLVGKFITAPSVSVSLSIGRISWRMSAPDPQLAALLRTLQNKLAVDPGEMTNFTPGSACKWFVALHGMNVEYVPPVTSDYDFLAVLVIGAVRVTLVSVCRQPSFASAIIRDVALYLKNTRVNHGILDVTSDDSFECQKLVQIATADLLDLSLVTDDRTYSVTQGSINLESGMMCTYLCSDSLQILVNLLHVVKQGFSNLAGACGRNDQEVNSMEHRHGSLDQDLIAAYFAGLQTTLDSPVAESGPGEVDRDPRVLVSTLDYMHSDPELCRTNDECSHGYGAWYGRAPRRLIFDHFKVPDAQQSRRAEMILPGASSLNLSLRDVQISFFAGHDWDNTRDVNGLVKVVVHHTLYNLLVCTGASRSHLCVGNVEVSESISSHGGELKPVLAHWQSNEQHPRESGEGFLQLDASVELRATVIKVKVLPLRCCLDAQVICFFNAFLSILEKQGASKQQPEYESKIFIIDVASLALNLDYQPRGLSATLQCSGSLGGLSEAFSLERVQVTTRRCRIVSKTLKLAWNHLWRLWSSELSEEQMHKFICGASVVRPLHAVGASIANMIHRPLEANTGKGQWRSLRRELTKCGRVLVCESARVSRRLVTGLAVALDATATNIGGRDKDSRASPSTGVIIGRGDVRGRLEDARGAICQGLGGAHNACAAAIERPSLSTLASVAPVAILCPAAGMAQGIAVLLLGVEQSADSAK